MFTNSRRTFLLSGAAAAATLGMDKRLAIAGPNPAERLDPAVDPAYGVHKYRVGAAECTALYDGIWVKAHDPGLFSNASVADTKKALQAAHLPSNYVPIPLTALVIKLNGRLVLCDAGGGGQVNAFDQRSRFISGKLMGNMKAAGIDPKKIEMILISHFHPDHIFGLMEKGTNAPVFPNAEIIVAAPEFRWWTDPSVIGRLPPGRRPLAQRIQATFPTWKNIRQVEDAAESVPGLRFVATPGHTA